MSQVVGIINNLIMYNNEYHRAHANLKYPIEKQTIDDGLIICYSCG
jgi:hypothetical protein